MPRRSVSVLTVTLLLASACAVQPELAGADLPLAEKPDTVEQATWGLPFAVEFPAGYWEAGAHRYRFLIDCPVLEAEVESLPVEFRVTPLTPTLNKTVYLRMAGLSDGIMMPANVRAIHPDQATTAVVTFLGLSQATIDEASSCEGLVEFDGDRAELMQPGEPFRP